MRDYDERFQRLEEHLAPGSERSRGGDAKAAGRAGAFHQGRGGFN